VEGFPLSAAAVGFGAPEGWDASTLAAVSTAIRSAGKRVFVTTYTTPGQVGLDEIGLRADLVELRPRSADPSALAVEVELAVRTLRGTGHPLIYVGVPRALASSTDDVGAVGAAIDTRIGGVGLALPESTSSDVVGALRTPR
jgi:hypothetical protein